MFDFHHYYQTENSAVLTDYQQSIRQIEEICAATADSNQGGKKEYHHFFHTLGTHILHMTRLEKKLSGEYFNDTPFEQLLAENQSLYHELQPANYSRCYADPHHCSELFGDKFGPLMAAVYQRFRQYITFSFQHELFNLLEWNQLYISAWQYVSQQTIQYEELRELLTSVVRKHTVEHNVRNLRQQHDPAWRPWRDVIEVCDLQDLRYLLRYGSPITENEIRTARFLLAYPQEKLQELADQIAAAFLTGFISDNKKRGERNQVMVMYQCGQEPLIRVLLEALEQRDLIPVVMHPAFTPVNRQYYYDHRNQAALWVDSEGLKESEECYETACKQQSQLLHHFAGSVYLDVFGEPPFSPVVKAECPEFSDEQKKLLNQHRYQMSQISERYKPRDSTSFCMIAFPSPLVGERFEEIFADIMQVNMLNTKDYEQIQQHLIDALDQAEHVHLKGRGDNRTDVKVSMQQLDNPAEQTNFCNCGADVNIPVGEVFTSPRLQGTEGTLHVSRTYLNELRYDDLELQFKDGMVDNYSCANFDNEEENRKYIRENLLFPHETLPLGEFAIGTNTLAWVIAEKYDIQHLLPILIIEKMGPHFAIGDTCFSQEEDHPVFNSLDNKEITARDNEKSILRKSDPSQAYTFCHTDITLPYDEIGSIATITKEGERIEIIRDGRFVLPGTEALNKPLDEAGM